MNKANILLTLTVALLLRDSTHAQDFAQYSPSSGYVSMDYHYSNGRLSSISYFSYLKKVKGGLGAVAVSATKSGQYTDTVSTGEILKITLEFNTTIEYAGSSFDYSEIQLNLLSPGGIQNFVYRVSATYVPNAPFGSSSWQKLRFDTCTSITIARWPPTAVEDPDRQSLPKSFSLFQNYPNPFNPSTTISYAIPKSANVSLGIFNSLGQEVAVLVHEQKETGYYQSTWNADVPSGIYFYRLQARQIDGGQAGEFVETRKLILLK